MTTEQQAEHVAIGGKLLVSVPLEFLWAIKERMENVREHIACGHFIAAANRTRDVETDINALVAKASLEAEHAEVAT